MVQPHQPDAATGNGGHVPPAAAPKPDPNSKKQDKSTLSPRTWLKVAIVVALLVALALYLLRNVLLGTPTSVYTAASSELVQSVVASGRVISPQRVTVALQ